MFLYNPNVKKVFNFANPLYFYEDYLTDDESFVIKYEPYIDYNYYAKKGHIIECWNKGLGLPTENREGDIFFLHNEMSAGKTQVAKLTDGFKKELVLFQWTGGKAPEKATQESYQNSLMPMYKRSLPQETAQEIVDALKAKGYVVGVVGHPNYPELKGAEKIFAPIRSTLVLTKFAKGFIAIDSFLQHACACKQIDLKGVVVWGGTSPDKLGYEKHTNLRKNECPSPECHRPNSYLFDVQPHGAIWDCPHGTPCLTNYTSKEIMKAFENTVEPKKKKKKK